MCGQIAAILADTLAIDKCSIGAVKQRCARFAGAVSCNTHRHTKIMRIAVDVKGHLHHSTAYRIHDVQKIRIALDCQADDEFISAGACKQFITAQLLL